MQHHFKFTYIYKLADLFMKRTAQSSMDIKTLPEIKIANFGPQSWIFINQFMNVLNDNLFELAKTQKIGNQAVNFQTVVKNPSAATRFAGGLKSLFKISNSLWEIVTETREQPYSTIDAQQIIDKLSDEVNNSNFPEPSAQDIKPKLISILNNWLAILK